MSNRESHDKTATRPLTATVMAQSPPSRIARRTPWTKSRANHTPDVSV
jgi:hypothetical protein